MKKAIFSSCIMLFLASGITFAQEETQEKLKTRIELSLSVIDAVKTISVTANEISNGTEIPLDSVNISFYVQRYFSNLKIGEGSIKKGQCSIAFPYNDLPGDSVGNVIILAKIEDNSTYGNVEKKETIAWGIPVHYTRENSGISLSLLFGYGSHEKLDYVFLGIISVIILLILTTIVFYKRA